MNEPNPSFGLDAAASATSEIKKSITEMVSQFNDLKCEVKTKLESQEKDMNAIERKNSAYSRPMLASSALEQDPHHSAFGAYVRTGDDDALRGLVLEGKSMSTAINSDGGYLVDAQTSDTIKSSLRGASSLRAIANVVTVEATSYDVLVDHTDMGAGWSDETTATGETDTPAIDRISIPLYELSALPKASQRLLDDSAFDVEGWLAARISEKFTRAEGAAFVMGDGIDKPRGFLTYPQVATGSEAWGQIGYVATGAAGDFATNAAGEALIDLVYALGAQYRANASFVMNSKTAGHVRKIKDADGRFLWADSLAAGEPARLLGYPVLISEDMPDIADGETAIAFGDFAAGYTIAERPDLRVLRDPFSAKPHVLFYATKRVGGDVSDFAAIKLLKFAAS